MEKDDKLLQKLIVVYSDLVTKVRDCAKSLPRDVSGKERLQRQIDCVLEKFGKKKHE